MAEDATSAEDQATPKDTWTRENIDKHRETIEKFINVIKILAGAKVPGAARIVKFLEPLEAPLAQVKFVETMADTGSVAIVQWARAVRTSRGAIDAYISEKEQTPDGIAEAGGRLPILALAGGFRALLGGGPGSFVDNVKDQATTGLSNWIDQQPAKIHKFLYQVKHHEFKTIARESMNFFIDHGEDIENAKRSIE